MELDRIKNLNLTGVVRQATGRWLVTWDATRVGAVYRVVEGSRLVTVTGLTRITLDTDGSEPVVEVSDMEACLSEAFPPSLAIQWYKSEGVSYYAVQRFTTEWVTAAIIPAEGQYSTYNLGGLVSDQYEFRVIAYNDEDEASGPLEITREVVTPPDPPDAVISYEDGEVVISDA